MKKEKIRKLMKEITHLTMNAALTGEFNNPKVYVKYYNDLYNTALENKYIEDGGFFRKMEENAGLDEIGVAASLLSVYLKEDKEREVEINYEITELG